MNRTRIRWAPKVSRESIARFYHEELTGRADLASAERLGTALYLRCEAFKLYASGQLKCPDCATVFAFPFGGNPPADRGVCPKCGWYVTLEEYGNSRRHKDLNVTNAMPAVDAFLAKYPACRELRALMVAIDQLIHAFHWDGKSKLPNRSLASNLIEGSHRQVVDFLDTLSSADTNLKTDWRKTVDLMWRRRRGEPKN